MNDNLIVSDDKRQADIKACENNPQEIHPWIWGVSGAGIKLRSDKLPDSKHKSKKILRGWIKKHFVIEGFGQDMG